MIKVARHKAACHGQSANLKEQQLLSIYHANLLRQPPTEKN